MMQALSLNDLLQLHESCERLRPTARALTILGRAAPELSSAELSRLSIGDRDERLLALRAATFGPHLDCSAICPACEERLEFTLNAEALRLEGRGSTEFRGVFDHEGNQIPFRTLNSDDLLLVERTLDPDSARAVLIKRALELDVEGSGETPALTPELVAGLAAALERADPLAALNVTLQCAACKHSWTVLFEVVTHLWNDIRETVERLVREVHLLARAYSWSERAILRMSATRRKLYLDQIYE
jgi:hypothetical protein